MRRVWLALAGAAVASVALSDPARADLVYLTSGRTLSVKSVRLEGDQAVMTLRGGGAVVCAATLIARVAPDEVPYPEEPEVVADTRVADAAPFADLIEPLATRHQIDPSLVRAVVEVESAYVPTARSRKGAMGLMQLMPATAKRYAVDDPFDPEENLEAGIRHLRDLLDRYEVSLALAAYNAGEGAVLRYGGVPPFQETRDYVARVLRRAGLASGRAPRPAASTPVAVARARS
jgi:soluble lytic murein transglycosylase-like protein